MVNLALRLLIPLLVVLAWNMVHRTALLRKLVEQYPRQTREAYGTPQSTFDEVWTEMCNRYAMKVFTGYKSINRIERALYNSEQVKRNGTK